MELTAEGLEGRGRARVSPRHSGAGDWKPGEANRGAEGLKDFGGAEGMADFGGAGRSSNDEQTYVQNRTSGDKEHSVIDWTSGYEEHSAMDGTWVGIRVGSATSISQTMSYSSSSTNIPTGMDLMASSTWSAGRRMSSDKGGFDLGSVALKANATQLTLHTIDPVIRQISFVILSGLIRLWWEELV